MTRLTLTSKGQVTIRKEVLSHLGVKPGDKVEVDLQPDGSAILRAAPKGDIRDVFGMLQQADGKSLTIEEINDVIADGWAEVGSK